jgi:hypothetical protein
VRDFGYIEYCTLAPRCVAMQPTRPFQIAVTDRSWRTNPNHVLGYLRGRVWHFAKNVLKLSMVQ